MKLKIEISLDDDVITNTVDGHPYIDGVVLSEMMSDVFYADYPKEVTEKKIIQDSNGNSVGTWEIVDE